MARQPALQTPRGVVRPACCRTDEWGIPRGDGRIDERHIGLRFGDRRDPNAPWRILLDGEDVTNQATEALAGEDGFVILYDEIPGQGRYVCPFGRKTGSEHALTVKKFGRVDVVRVPPS